MNEVRKLMVFDEALKQLKNKISVGSSNKTSDWRSVPLAIRQRAFFSAGLESERVAESMRSYLETYLAAEGSMSRADFVAEMRRLVIKEGIGKMLPDGTIDPRIDNSDLTDLRSLRRLQLIFDTNVEQARSFAQWREGQDEDVLWVWPAWRFVRVRPVGQPRDYHEAALGEVRRKDDLDFWMSLNRDFGVPYGPWGFESGCGVDEVERDEAIKLGLIKESEVIKPQLAELNDRFSASVEGLGGTSRQSFIKYCKSQGMSLSIKDGRARIKSSAKAPAKLKPLDASKPKTAAEALAKAKIEAEGEVTIEQCRILKEAIAGKHSQTINDYCPNITTIHTKLSAGSLQNIMSDFVGMVDKDVLEALPKISSIGNVPVASAIRGVRGDYIPEKHNIRYASDCDPTTFFHELIHWLHLNHPNRQLYSELKDYFNQRTKGLRPVQGVIEDDFLDYRNSTYAGRIYKGLDRGLELPTRHLEKLALSPDALANHMNHRSPKTGKLMWREAFIKCLPLLYY